MIGALSQFFDSDQSRVFLLKGYAGTGKTYILRQIAEALSVAKLPFCLLTPTGRAARILGKRTGFPARTIHSLMYAMNQVREYEKDEERFQLHFELSDPSGIDSRMVFLVDESSLIGDREGEQEFLRFGSGRLLKDFIDYTRVGVSGLETRIVFAGDPAQLPPVNDNISPALSSEYLKKTHNLVAQTAELTEVVRQKGGSPVLRVATELRNSLANGRVNKLAVPEEPPAIRSIQPADASKLIAEACRVDAMAEEVLVTYSNELALKYNQAVRGHLYGNEQASVRVGDRVMVNTNNPCWGLMNGDFAALLGVAPEPEIRQVAVRGQDVQALIFRRVTAGWLNAENQPVRLECLVMENLLDSRERDLTRPEMMALYVDFKNRNPDLKPHTRDFETALRADEYFNALRVKYGYAVTCHKAQGGEWDRVIVDFRTGGGWSNPAYFRWCYTAITRARSELLTINAPQFVHSWVGIRRVGVGKGEGKLLVAAVLVDSGEDEGMERKPKCSVDEASGEISAGTPGCTGEQQDEDKAGWPGVKWAEGHEPLKLKANCFAAMLRAQGFEVGVLEHGNYFERYTIMDGARPIKIQVYYDGRMRFRVPQPMPRGKVSVDDPAFKKIAALFLSAIPEDGGMAEEGAKPQAVELRAKLEELRAQGVDVLRLDSGEYVDRVTLRRETSVAEVDFYHDRKGRYTSWQIMPTRDPEFRGWLTGRIEDLLMTPEQSAVQGVDLLE
jgi:hypothetical protein